MDTGKKNFIPEKRLFGGNGNERGGNSNQDYGPDESMSLAMKSVLLDSKKKDEINKYLSPIKFGLNRPL